METFTVSPSSLTSYQNKTVLITGGSSGIGIATALLIASLSADNNIAILDRSPPPVSLAASLSPSQLLYHPTEITSWHSQRAGFAAAAQKFGRIDAVFVNAGISEHGEQFFTDALDAEGLLVEPDRRTLDIDMSAASDSVKLAIHYLRKNRDGGSIVATASLAGYLASAGAPLYSAAKHGIIGLMRALKNDTARLNIAISIVAPGITTTPLLSQNNPSAAFKSPQDYATSMQQAGVAVNKAETVALAVAHLMSKGMEGNGAGLLVQGDRMADVESGLAKSREVWMGREMLGLFKGGRNAPLFSRIVGKL